MVKMANVTYTDPAYRTKKMINKLRKMNFLSASMPFPADEEQIVRTTAASMNAFVSSVTPLGNDVVSIQLRTEERRYG